jgi:methionyl-tRNA synthetase
MENKTLKTIEIYEDCYCDKCEIQLTSENYTDETQHCGEDRLYCDKCWKTIPQSGW